MAIYSSPRTLGSHTTLGSHRTLGWEMGASRHIQKGREEEEMQKDKLQIEREDNKEYIYYLRDSQ